MNGCKSVLVFLLCLNGIYSSPWTNKKTFFIIGGNPVFQAELPFIVSLQTDRGTHVCGGNIITKNVILTAAHCFSYYPTKLVAGVVDITHSLDKIERNIIVSSIRKHPRFRSGASLYDIAVFKVHPFYYKFNLQPVAIENLKFLDNFWIPGKAAGWGTSNRYSTSYSPKLLSAELRILSPMKCYDELGDDVTEGLICALPWSINEDACQGDSGGPLLHNGNLVAYYQYWTRLWTNRYAWCLHKCFLFLSLDTGQYLNKAN